MINKTNDEIIKEVIKYQTDTLEVLMNKAREDEKKKCIKYIEIQLGTAILDSFGDINIKGQTQNRDTCELIIENIEEGKIF